MTVPKSLIVIIAITSPLLSGCTIFGGHHLGAQAVPWTPSGVEPAAGYAAAQMAEGRKALGDAQYGLAIIDFRNAQRFPEFSAAAANGLGVAYAQIGRSDVAQHYFELAVSEDPGDMRFSANLDRLRYQMAMTRAAATSEEGLAAGEQSQLPSDHRGEVLAAYPGTATRAGLRVEDPAAKMVRVSETEVRLGSADDEHPNLERRASGATIVATSAQPVRRRNPNYPVRIELAPAAAVADASNKQTYPVRIEF